jgi:hypothetical protein
MFLQWLIGAAAVAGSLHGVSGATGITPTAYRGTNSVLSRAVTFSATATPPAGGTATAQLYRALANLPPGLTMGTRGTVQGTPTRAGEYLVQIRGYKDQRAFDGLNDDWVTLNVPFSIVSSGVPVITNQPAGTTVAPGGTATFSVTAGGAPGDLPPVYRWLKEDIELRGATNATLELPNITEADAGRYFVRISNDRGAVISEPATLIVSAVGPSGPAITGQPLSRAAHEGEGATFEVTATGENLAYAWTKDGAAIPDATAARLILTNLTATNAGIYVATVISGAASTNSDPAVLSVFPALQITNTFLSASNLVLQFNGLTNRSYQVLTTPALAQPFAAAGVTNAAGVADSVEVPLGSGDTGLFRLQSLE